VAAVVSNLNDCIVTDSGEVAFKFEYLFEKLSEGHSIEGLAAVRHPDIDIYNRRKPATPIRIINFDGEIAGLPEDSWDWILPNEYRNIDLVKYCHERLEEKLPDHSQEYLNRLDYELEHMHKREMDDFIRCIIFVFETLEIHDVFHGVGRGSACASLVLYLIGVHMVDPIEYDIPINEFLR
jgi:hypothetical protein